MRDNRNDPTPYAIYCRGDSVPGQKPCGLVFLDHAHYIRELMRPNLGWSCPKCGSTANWDDDCQETNPPEDQDVMGWGEEIDAAMKAAMDVRTTHSKED